MALEKARTMLIAAGFRGEDIHMMPAEMYLTRRLTDGFLTQATKTNEDFVQEAQARGFASPVIIPEGKMTLIVAIKTDKSRGFLEKMQRTLYRRAYGLQ